MPLVRVPPISITQDAGLQLVKVRPFKWMKMKGGGVAGGREREKKGKERQPLGGNQTQKRRGTGGSGTRQAA